MFAPVCLSCARKDGVFARKKANKVGATQRAGRAKKRRELPEQVNSTAATLLHNARLVLRSLYPSAKGNDASASPSPYSPRLIPLVLAVSTHPPAAPAPVPLSTPSALPLSSPSWITSARSAASTIRSPNPRPAPSSAVPMYSNRREKGKKGVKQVHQRPRPASPDRTAESRLS